MGAMRTRTLPALAVAFALAAGALGPPLLAVTASEARTQAFALQSEGMRLYREGKYRDAIQAFQRVVNLNLNSFLAYYYLGVCLLADRRYAEAIDPLKIALDLQPDYVQAHLALGDAFLKQGDTDEARAEYLRAIELQPNYAQAHDGLGRLLESTGRDAEAEQQYRRALEINVAYADAYTHLGDLYLRKDRLRDAIELFLKAISIKPDFGSAYMRLGVAYARERLYDDAIAATRKSMDLAPQDPEPYVALARIYLDLESYGRAEATVEAALAQDHGHPGAHLILSDLKRAREDFAAAVEVLEDLHERGIEDAQMRRQVATALRRAREDAARHATLKSALERTPPQPAALVDLARFLSAQGAHRRAAALLDRAAALQEEAGAPDPAAALRFERGLELQAGRLYSAAAETFERLAGAGTSGGAGADLALRDAARFNLGVTRASMGLHEQAYEAFAAYRRDHPDDARALLYLGNASYRLGRNEEARAAYSAFLDKSSPGPEADRVQRILQRLEQPARAGGASADIDSAAGGSAGGDAAAGDAVKERS
jgi:tetratricopeptide (TPR) repeat protein